MSGNRDRPCSLRVLREMVWPSMAKRLNSGCHVRDAAEAKSTDVRYSQFRCSAATSLDCVHRNGKLCAFRASAMNIRGLGTARLRLKLRIMGDEDLWWLFVNHREECSREFWEELENRKAAGTLSEGSLFWTVRNIGRHIHPRGSGDNSNLIELTREEWEARRRRKMFRVISA